MVVTQTREHSVPMSRETSRSDGVPARRSASFWLTGLVAMLAAVASAAGLFAPGLFRDPPNWAAQARGTDLITLAVAVPLLVTAPLLAARGSLWARFVWLGALGYTLYMYGIAAFDVAFNPLFLVYVALLSLSVFSIIILITELDARAIHVRAGTDLTVRTTAAYLLGLAALFSLLWMRDIVPALAHGANPASLNGTTLPTNPVHVLDLSLLLPLAALSGIWLWQCRPRGYLAASVMLTTLTMVGASVVSGIVFEYRNDASVSLAPVPVLALVTLIGLGLLVVYLRHFNRVLAK
ncbi:MAG TPA: hypothetical protein VKU87_05430 [Thermomicrobiaceae bacterium]|nr:hypothetical protein [Thermomicrobiaceae bacterium]